MEPNDNRNSLQGVKSPLDPFGHNVSHFTKRLGAEADEKNRASTGRRRGFIIAVGMPVVTISTYLLVTGQEVRAPEFADEKRAPASYVPLPPPLADAGFSAPALGPAVKPQPLKITLDADGEMTSPYSVELDENGDEVARRELEDHLAFLPPLPLGEFASIEAPSMASVPDGFIAVPQARPFSLREPERRKISEARIKSAEIQSAAAKFAAIAAAGEEFVWLRAASLAQDMTGDRTLEKRMMETILLITKTRKISGFTMSDAPLLDMIYAYDHVRHLFSDPDRAVIDGFLRRLVDAQFLRMKSHRLYDVAHAAHLRFALAVGFVIESASLQYYGLKQYEKHVENSGVLDKSFLGNADVATVNQLLHAAFLLERSGSALYRNARLNLAIDNLARATQVNPQAMIETLSLAAYFRPDIGPVLPTIATAAGVTASRFGSPEGAIFANLRKPSSTLVAPSDQRQPSALPLKLPAKRIQGP